MEENGHLNRVDNPDKVGQGASRRLARSIQMSAGLAFKLLLLLIGAMVFVSIMAIVLCIRTAIKLLLCSGLVVAFQRIKSVRRNW